VLLKWIEEKMMIQFELASWEQRRLCVQMECGGEETPPLRT
jgi:hypothetical protein